MPINFDLKKYKNDIFIETGTYKGDGVKKALNAGFNNIYSIEIDHNRFLKCDKMFENYKNVKIIYGDSGKILPSLLKNINKKVTFWLDAHYCADGAFIGEKWCPMKEEFDAISNHHIKEHTILIDDWRCMENTHIDYTWIKQCENQVNNTIVVNENKGKEVGFLGKIKCLRMLKKINKDYKITFENGIVENDVLVCKINNTIL